MIQKSTIRYNDIRYFYKARYPTTKAIGSKSYYFTWLTPAFTATGESGELDELK